MRTVLVTGGAGFIGGCFVRQSLASGDLHVINLDKLTYAGNLDSLAPIADHPNHMFVHGDIGDDQLVPELLEKYHPSAIVHFAAETHVDRSIDAPQAFVETNVVGTFRLLEAARQYWRDLPAQGREAFRFLHVSTDEVYGSLGPNGQFTESTPYAPNSPYSASKAAADHFVRAYHHTYGLPTIISHCSNNYGPYQFPEKLIPRMILNAVAGKELPIYGDGQNIRDWLFVEDHCRALSLILDRGRPGAVYNVGGNSERSNLQVVETICSVLDRLIDDPARTPSSRLITFVNDRPGHDRRYAIDATKLRAKLGWESLVNFEAGLEHTIRWYLEHTKWVQRVRSGSSRRTGL